MPPPAIDASPVEGGADVRSPTATRPSRRWSLLPSLKRRPTKDKVGAPAKEANNKDPVDVSLDYYDSIAVPGK